MKPMTDSLKYPDNMASISNYYYKNSLQKSVPDPATINSHHSWIYK